MKKVTAGEHTVLYALNDNQPEACGNIVSGTVLDVYQAGEYQKISGSEYYVLSSETSVSDRWMKNRTHLLPLGMKVVTKDGYDLEDFMGRPVLHAEKSAEYEVYALPTADDPRYGVLFEDAVFFIAEAEIDHVSESDGKLKGADHMPVLMYHFFYDESLGQSRADANYVEVREFDEQLSYLENDGFTTLTMMEVCLFMQKRAVIPEKSVAITIDDGDPTVHEYGYPVLRKHDMNATLFLITGWGDKGPGNYDFWEMREDGLELQSHGFLMHQGGCEGMGHSGRLMCVDHEEGVQDTLASYDAVDGGFVYCYPFGDVNENGISIMKDAGTKLAFTTEYGMIDPSMDMLRLPRIRVHGGNSLESFIDSVND